jgi:YD repeat-containing protein
MAAAVSLCVAAAAYATETTTYTYDPRGRLVKVKHEGTVNDGVTTQYGLDKADNRTNVTVTGAPNIITGTEAPETLNDTSANDIIYALGGNDWVNVYLGGNDTVLGGNGSDLFFFRGTLTSADAVDGGAGADQMVLQGNYSAGLTLGAGIVAVESVALLPASDTRFSGNGPGPFSYAITTVNQNVAAGQTATFDGTTLSATETFTFDGGAESDGWFSLFGGQANDGLAGGAGNDIIQGSLGADVLTGRGGGDTFKYRTANDSTAASTDNITDFTSGDVVHLVTIDANSTVAGDQAFTFIGASAFTGTAGQLRSVQQSGNSWLVQGDVDGNGSADLTVTLTSADAHALTAADFVL